VAQMFLAGAVATGAGGCAGIGHGAVAGLSNSQQLRAIAVIVTSGTGGITLENQVLRRVGRQRHTGAHQHSSGHRPH